MTLLYLSVLTIIAAAGSVLALHDRVLTADVCDGKLQQLANGIRNATNDVLAESVELALTVFSGFAPTFRRKNSLKVSSSDPHNHKFSYSQRHLARAHIMSESIDLKSLYVDLSKALKLRRSAKQYLAFTLAIGEIKAEYLMACFSSRPKPSLASLSSDLTVARAQKNKKLLEFMLRSVFAKAICFAIRQATARDFFKSITSAEATDIFGFNFKQKEDYFPALAFVIDTTGSMSGQIGTATRVIANIIKQEQQNPFFYVLTPFNDYGDGSVTPSKFHLNTYVTSIWHMQFFKKCTVYASVFKNLLTCAL